MANGSDEGTGEHGVRLSALAGTLAAMARRLAAALPNVAEQDVRTRLVASLDSIRSVSTSLRAIDLLYDPQHAQHFIRHGERLRRLAVDMSEIVGDLTVANQQASTRLNEHIQNLEHIAQESPVDMADRLQATVVHARAMADDMFQTFQTITSKVSSATERVTAMEGELAEARERALLDALTRVHSRAALDVRLQLSVDEGEANGPWCLLLASVDSLRKTIESRGAIVGDALLYKVARVLENAVPSEEGRAFLARFGGEEFAILLARAKLPEARNVAEVLRRQVAEARWEERGKPEHGVIQTTISIGVVQYKKGDAVGSLVRRAELALREARKGGHNRVAAI